MKISIITAAYNAAATIADTLGSVAAQTHPDIEHIVIDGASRDDTQAIVQAHVQSVAKFISEPDQGIYDAMNKGILLASGEIIGFLNSDDVYAHSHVIADVVRLMERDNLDALYGDVAFFRPENPQRLVRRFRSVHFSPSRIAWGWMPAHPALFLHRRVYESTGLFRTDYRIAGDFEFVARAFHANALRYRYLPEVLVHMRTGGISTGGWRNTLLLNREVLRACRENGIRSNALMMLSKYPLKLLEFIQS
jgi:glycosyltransferase involved in cell wall biosynthesis